MASCISACAHECLGRLFESMWCALAACHHKPLDVQQDTHKGSPDTPQGKQRTHRERPSTKAACLQQELHFGVIGRGTTSHIDSGRPRSLES